jgi:hypothetical protein
MTLPSFITKKFTFTIAVHQTDFNRSAKLLIDNKTLQYMDRLKNAQKLEPKEAVLWYNNKDDLELLKKV